MKSRRTEQNITDRALETTEKAVDLVMGMIEYLRERPATDALNGTELEAAAKIFPQWSVNSGFSSGKAHKTYTRSLEDLKTWAEGTRDVYLRFSDSEYFDVDLLRIFESWQGTGDLGSYKYFTVIAEEEGPITYKDILRVAEAEKFLQETGYFATPELAPV